MQVEVKFIFFQKSFHFKGKCILVSLSWIVIILGSEIY